MNNTIPSSARRESTITMIEQANPSTYEKNGNVLNRWQVSFANGESMIMMSKGNFKKSVGEVVKYEIKNEKMNFASLVTDYNEQKSFPQMEMNKQGFIQQAPSYNLEDGGLSLSDKDRLSARSFALSYAKDLAVAKVIKPKDIETHYNNFISLLNGAE
jgi:hypothetical protein